MAKSTQTLYREKKRDILVDIINLCISLIILKKRQLQTVHLARFKKIKIELESMLNEAARA